MRKLLILLITLASAVGCTVYRLEIQQGNVLDPVAYEQLKVGMSRAQVQFLLGTPLIADPFHRNRWDYLFRKQRGKGKIEQEQISVYFVDEKLATVVRDVSTEARFHLLGLP